MAYAKRHLLKAGRGQYRRAACGLLRPSVWTENPEQVTCQTCRGSLYMADLEVRLANPQPPRRRRDRKD